MESEVDFARRLSFYSVGGAENMPMWLTQKVWVTRPEIGKIVLLDVKPSFGQDGSASATNPAGRHLPELRKIQTPIYAAQIDYTNEGPAMLVDCKPVNESAEAGPIDPLNRGGRPANGGRSRRADSNWSPRKSSRRQPQDLTSSTSVLQRDQSWTPWWPILPMEWRS